MISKERLRGNWNSLVGAVKEKFGEISGDDLKRVEGNIEQLVGLIQRKTGQSREQIEAFVGDCCDSTASTVDRLSETASEYAGVAGEAIRDGYDRVAAEAQRGYDYTVGSMKRRPVESMAMAVGVGLLAGLVLGISIASSNRR